MLQQYPESASERHPRLLRIASRGTATAQRWIGVKALAAVAFLWIPCAILSLAAGTEQFRWFLTDFATQSRILFIVPTLIVATPSLSARLMAVAHRFITSKIVGHSGSREVEIQRQRLETISSSQRAAVVLAVTSVLIVVIALPTFHRSTFPLPWSLQYGATSFSPAGWWQVLVLFPTLVFLFLRWIWIQCLWMNFLFRVSRLKLRLLPTHPDHVGGLGFLEWCEWEYIPFCLAMGALFAGGIANRIAFAGTHISAFRFSAAIPVLIVLLICVLPLTVFHRPLTQAKREGVFSHGELAAAIGRHFEDKWLADSVQINYSALTAHDLPGTKHFLSVLENAYKMKFVPITSQMVMRLVAWTLTPMIPVAIASIPFEALIQQLIKMLL